jgi:hypothetical protein
VSELDEDETRLFVWATQTQTEGGQPKQHNLTVLSLDKAYQAYLRWDTGKARPG